MFWLARGVSGDKHRRVSLMRVVSSLPDESKSRRAVHDAALRTPRCPVKPATSLEENHG
jgi:hypothetical protein